MLALESFMDGEKFKVGAHVIKDVAGYNVKSLLVGSEGTLAVISKIILRLIPLPQYRRLFRLDFDSLVKGAEFITQMLKKVLPPLS